MSKPNDGGPAYPGGESYTKTDLAGNRTEYGKSPLHRGMSLRDAIAIAAMQGLIVALPNSDGGPKDYAHDAYLFADAMLAERGKEAKP